MTCSTDIFDGVNLTLHDVEFVIHRGQTLGGLDDDQSIHTVGNVLSSEIRPAVIDKYARDERLEGESPAFALFCFREVHASARAKSGVQVNGMGNKATVIFQRKF